MIKLNLNIIFFLITVGIYSQTNIYGTVTDQGSSEVIPFALLKLKYGDTIVDTESDFDGKFKFYNIKADSSTLIVRSISCYDFDSILLHPSDSLMLNIKLIPDSTSENTLFMAPFDKKSALNDIANGDIKLLLPGGLVGAPHLSGDSSFERKYHVTFIRQGCVRYIQDKRTGYNYEIFKYLDETYGREWRKEVRKDVIGLKK